MKEELRIRLFNLRLEQTILQKKYRNDTISETLKASTFKRLKEIDAEITKIKHLSGRKQFAEKERSRKV